MKVPFSVRRRWSRNAEGLRRFAFRVWATRMSRGFRAEHPISDAAFRKAANESPETMLGISDDSIRRSVVAILIRRPGNATQLLPELLDVFGQAATQRFLRVFAGVTFTVPSEEDVALAARDASIHRDFVSNDGINAIASRYGVRSDAVLAIVREVHRSLVLGGLLDERDRGLPK